MADWLKDLQRVILGMEFVPMDQREHLSAGIPYLPPEDLNRFLDLLISLVCGEVEKLLLAIRREYDGEVLVTKILNETIPEER